MGSKTETKSDLPPLPENEKTYAGIPEAVFVVSNLFVWIVCDSFCEKKKIED